MPRRYFWSKVNIRNVNCVRATAFVFDTRTDVLVKVSKFLRQKMSRPEGDSNPHPSDSCRMLWPFELSGPDICCPMFFDTFWIYHEHFIWDFPEVTIYGCCRTSLDYKSTLVQVMAWCHQAPSHYLNQCWPCCMKKLLTGVCGSGFWSDTLG